MISQRLLLALVVLGTLSSCDRRGSTHGIRDIEVSPGKHLYFKREVRGRNFDSWWISQNPDVCAELDPSTDAEFPAVGPLWFYYRIKAGKLELMGTPGLTMPQKGNLADLLHYEDLHPLDFQRLEREWESQGLTRLDDVPLNDSIVCF